VHIFLARGAVAAGLADCTAREHWIEDPVGVPPTYCDSKKAVGPAALQYAAGLPRPYRSRGSPPMPALSFVLCLLAGFAAVAATPSAAASATTSPPALQLPYGNAPQQFGWLHLPAGPGPHPLLVLLHGGCWQQRIADHEYLEPLARALTRHGWAVWNVEYLGTDQAGGGWPNTFLDVAAAVDHLRVLAERQPLDLQRVVFAGHSAGGQLALWAASRPRLARSSLLASATPLRPRRVLGLAAITDLAAYRRDNPDCAAAIPALIGPAALAEVSPLQMLPAAAPVTLITADGDLIVPEAQAQIYARAAAKAGAPLRRRRIAGDHFAVVEPDGAGLAAILAELQALR
jgi:acetyl esterase/lipase